MKKLILSAMVMLFVGCHDQDKELDRLLKKYPNAQRIARSRYGLIYVAKDSNNRVILIENSTTFTYTPVETVIIK